MYFTLAVFAGIVGFAVVGASVYTVWYMLHLSRLHKKERPEAGALQNASSYLLKWTAVDYAGLLLSIAGLLFLLADVIGVIRERESYPYYHYGYLLCAFVFLLISIAFLLMRLTIVLRLSRPGRPARTQDSPEPEQADSAEERV